MEMRGRVGVRTSVLPVINVIALRQTGQLCTYNHKSNCQVQSKDRFTTCKILA
jgi:hypothetical protein